MFELTYEDKAYVDRCKDRCKGKCKKKKCNEKCEHRDKCAFKDKKCMGSCTVECEKWCEGNCLAGSIGYANAEYDFTFEKRFIVYHALEGQTIHYIAFDKNTHLGSEIKSTTEVIEKEHYADMRHDILFSIKYTGDKRYLEY